MVTYFVVQSFSLGKRGALLPDLPVQATGEDHAKRLANRLAGSKVGVVAFSRSGDPSSGEYDDAVLIAAHGRLPDEMEASVAAA